MNARTKLQRTQQQQPKKVTRTQTNGVKGIMEYSIHFYIYIHIYNILCKYTNGFVDICSCWPSRDNDTEPERWWREGEVPSANKWMAWAKLSQVNRLVYDDVRKPKMYIYTSCLFALCAGHLLSCPILDISTDQKKNPYEKKPMRKWSAFTSTHEWIEICEAQ